MEYHLDTAAAATVRNVTHFQPNEVIPTKPRNKSAVSHSSAHPSSAKQNVQNDIQTKSLFKGRIMTAITTNPAITASSQIISPTGMVKAVMSAFAVGQQRRQLAKMTDQQLADIGVTRAQAVEEANKSFWNLPS